MTLASATRAARRLAVRRRPAGFSNLEPRLAAVAGATGEQGPSLIDTLMLHWHATMHGQVLLGRRRLTLHAIIGLPQDSSASVTRHNTQAYQDSS